MRAGRSGRRRFRPSQQDRGGEQWSPLPRLQCEREEGRLAVRAIRKAARTARLEIDDDGLATSPQLMLRRVPPAAAKGSSLWWRVDRRPGFAVIGAGVDCAAMDGDPPLIGFDVHSLHIGWTAGDFGPGIVGRCGLPECAVC